MSPNVFVTYCNRVKELREYPIFSDKKLIDIKAQDLISFYNYKRGKGLKDATIKKIANIIHPALRNAYHLDIIPKDIGRQIPNFKESKTMVRYFDKNELGKFLDIIKGHKNELAFKLACYYGFRRSEIIGLQWDAIDFERKTITIKHKVIISRRKIWAEDKLKTESSFRTLPLIPEIEKDLLNHKERVKANKKYFGSAYDNTYKDYIIVNDLGKIMFPDNLTHQFKLIVKKHKLKNIRFHDLRHSCASLLLSTGIHMKQIQEWLGHADFSTTANVYSHLDFSSKVESAQNIANALQGVYADKDERKQSEINSSNFVPSIHDPYKNKREIQEQQDENNNNEIEFTEDDYQQFQVFLKWQKERKAKLEEEM